MVEMNERRMPVGIQSFNTIRKEGYLYVDKSDLVWTLANKGKKYNYLSRPRRFGKSYKNSYLQIAHPSSPYLRAAPHRSKDRRTLCST